jgi:hypothetical protein
MSSRFGLLLLLVLAACTPLAPSEGALPFRTIEQKADAATIGQQQYDALEPGLLIIASDEDLAAYGKWFTENARDQMRRMNLTRTPTLAVFQGWKVGEGYGVSVSGVERQGNVIRVTAQFAVPGASTGGKVTSPYHLIALDGLVGANALEFHLIVSGETLAIIPTPTPIP